MNAHAPADAFAARAASPALPVTVLAGDGIGPEVVAAALRAARAAGARLDVTEAEAGARAFAAGSETGVPRETLDAVAATGLVLKGPLETPVGYGGKSANVTLRKLFELYGNVRPVRELPGVGGPFAGRGIDFTVVRENVEDLYAGIEHMQTPGVAQCLKLISSKGCEKIVRLAFETARAEGRASVTCATKANIMKLTEGLMKRSFEAVAKDYPEIEARHLLVDDCAHKLVRYPERFEVLVTTNMNGDILSDLAAGLVGGLGLAPSANLGRGIAMFEAVHGSAPDIAGRDLANPTALMLSAVMMLRHAGQPAAAEALETGLRVVLARGDTLTADLAAPGRGVSTAAFTAAVEEAVEAAAARIGEVAAAPPAPIVVSSARTLPVAVPAPASRAVIGADVFVEADTDAASLGEALAELAEGTPVRLAMISNRGTQVWPSAGGAPDLVDHWRCRFRVAAKGAHVEDGELLDLLARLAAAGHRWMHVEKLQSFDGTEAFTRAQGEKAA